MKRNRKLLAILTGVMTFGLMACQSEPLENVPVDFPPMGQLAMPGMNTSGGNNVGDVAMGRSYSDMQFLFEVIDANGEKVVSVPFVQGDVVQLPIGEGYTAKVYSADNPDAALETPCFEGESSQFDIRDNYITEIEPIKCTLKNIKISVVVTDRLAELLSDATVTITSAVSGAEIELATSELYSYNEQGEYVGTSAYFRYYADDEITVTFNGMLDGASLTSTTPLGELAEGQHRILYYGMKTNQGKDPQLPEVGDDPDDDSNQDPAGGDDQGNGGNEQGEGGDNGDGGDDNGNSGDPGDGGDNGNDNGDNNNGPEENGGDNGDAGGDPGDGGDNQGEAGKEKATIITLIQNSIK